MASENFYFLVFEFECKKPDNFHYRVFVLLSDFLIGLCYYREVFCCQYGNHDYRHCDDFLVVLLYCLQILTRRFCTTLFLACSWV